MTRFFYNLPAMSSIAEVEAAADLLEAKRLVGYPSLDGYRACVEIDSTVADLLEHAAIEVEVRGCALEAIADGMKSNS